MTPLVQQMPSAKKLRAVLFDLGGTLFKTAEPPEIHRRILSAYGVNVASEDVARAHVQNEKEFDLKKMAEYGAGFWVEWNTRLLERLGIEGDVRFLARKIDELWWEYADLQVYPDAIDTLVRLREKGMKLGVVTNAFRKDFDQILERLGLTTFFDIVVGVDACNKAKPDEKIFLYAVEKLHIDRAEALFVGNSVEYDFDGARNAGLRPLLVNRDESTSSDVDTIRSLTEVLAIV
jgi:putative hydrolase of the HAD superfamily